MVDDDQRAVTTMKFVAEINRQKCTRCRKCVAICEPDAVVRQGAHYYVAPDKCNGCGICVKICPAKSIKLKSKY